MPASAPKLLAGALIAGITIATGETTLVATAAAVGANWLGDGLAALRPRLAVRPAAGPLDAAYAAAIRDGVAGLERTYRRTVDPKTDGAAFALIMACADDIAGAEYPAAVTDVATTQAALAGALDALLYGHDERQAAYLRAELLLACAIAFQRRLVADDAAWRAFHGLLLQSMAAGVAALAPRLDRFTDVLAAFADPAAGLAALGQSLARLEAAAARIENTTDRIENTTGRIETTTGETHATVRRVEDKVDRLADTPRQGGITFNNQDMTVGGNVYQSGTQYINSAHAQGGGHATVVNNLGTPAPTHSLTPSSPHPAILFLSANPTETARLRLDAEARAIDERLRQGDASGRFVLHQQWAVRSGDLVDALLSYRPVIVHFAGHGSPDGALVVETVEGRAIALSPAAVAALFAAAPGVRCIVLNACWSDTQASLLAAHVDCVVGMTDEIDDAAAAAFVAGFYRALAAGESVATALDLGRAQIRLEVADPALAEQQAALPRLHARPGLDPAVIRFFAAPSRG